MGSSPETDFESNDSDSEAEVVPKQRGGRVLSTDVFKYNVTRDYKVEVPDDYTSKVKTSYYWDRAILVPKDKNSNLPRLELSIGSIVFGWTYSCPLVVMGFSSLNPNGKPTLGVIVRDIYQIDENYKLPDHIQYTHPNKKNRLKAQFLDQKPFLKMAIDSIIKYLGIFHEEIVGEKEKFWHEMLFYFEHFARKPPLQYADNPLTTIPIPKAKKIELRRSTRKSGAVSLAESDTEESSGNENEELSVNNDDDNTNNDHDNNNENNIHDINNNNKINKNITSNEIDDNFGSSDEELEIEPKKPKKRGRKKKKISNAKQKSKSPNLNSSASNLALISPSTNVIPTPNSISKITSSIEKVAFEISQMHSRDMALLKEVIDQQNESRKYLEKSHQLLLNILSKREFESENSEPPKKKHKTHSEVVDE